MKSSVNLEQRDTGITYPCFPTVKTERTQRLESRV